MRQTVQAGSSVPSPTRSMALQKMNVFGKKIIDMKLCGWLYSLRIAQILDTCRV